MFVGFIAGLICYAKQIPWKEIWKHLGDGTKDGTGSLFNTAAVVGFGSLVQVTPAFNTLIGSVTKIGGSPLIASALAVTVLAGVCGSGSGGLGIAASDHQRLLCSAWQKPEALHRVSALASFRLGSSSAQRPWLYPC